MEWRNLVVINPDCSDAACCCGHRRGAAQTGKIAPASVTWIQALRPVSAVLADAFRQELSELGWIEGKNISIEYRFAEQEAERLPELAAELVRLGVDLIVTTGDPPTFAAKKVTTTIPIVMTASSTESLKGWLPVSRGREAMSPGSRV